MRYKDHEPETTRDNKCRETGWLDDMNAGQANPLIAKPWNEVIRSRIRVV